MAIFAEQLEKILQSVQTGFATTLQEVLSKTQPVPGAPPATLPNPTTDHGPRTPPGRLEPKAFNRLDKSTSGEVEWREWKFDFMTIIESLNPGMGKLTKTVEDEANEPTSDGMKMFYYQRHEDDGDAPPEVQTRSKELFYLLCTLTGGGTKMLVRDLEDGLMAWWRLNATYSRRTLARTPRNFKEAVAPKLGKKPEEVIARISEWEAKVKLLARRESAELDPMLRLAILSELCPLGIRDIVYQQMDEKQRGTPAQKKELYNSVKEKVIAWTSNRVASSAAVSMDVGLVGQCGCCCTGECWDGTGDVTDFEVNMVGQCYTCGVVGHLARLCPSKGFHKGAGKGGPKGGSPSKGVFGKGGFGKGFGGKGKGGGGGKGYQGYCFNCVRQGHKAAECRGGTRHVNLVAEGAEEASTGDAKEIGGVWFMGLVEKIVEMKTPVATRNRFAALEVEGETLLPVEPNMDKLVKPTAITDGMVAGKPVKSARVPPVKKLRPMPTWRCRNTLASVPEDFPVLSTPGESQASIPAQQSSGPYLRACEGTHQRSKFDNRSDRSPRQRSPGLPEPKPIFAVERKHPGMCQMTFHVTGSPKFLASVDKMVEAGNEVRFTRGESYIKCVNSGQKALLKKERGVFVMDVIFLNGALAEPGQVVVDSGVVDNVMPVDMLAEVEMREKQPGTRFMEGCDLCTRGVLGT